MKRDTALWQFSGFAFTSLGGTLLHFLYDRTGKSILTAPISGVNESTWEHMKLLYFPLLIFTLIQGLFFRDQKNFFCIKLGGTVAGLLLIPAIFYTYNGAFGKSPDWLNITIFFISAAATYYIEWRLFKKDSVSCRNPRLAFILLCSVGALFVIFTFATPRLPLFRDPVTGAYGLL